MIPGLGFLYSGLARRKSALSMIWACMGSFSVITFQWYFWGYSLAFSPSGTSGFIGDLKHFGLTNTLGAPSPASPLIPELLYSFYQVRTTLLVCFALNPLTIFADAIYCHHCRHCCWSRGRAWSIDSHDGLHLLLGDPRLLSNCLLGLEHRWLGLHLGCAGLRRWWTRRNRFWYVRFGILDGPWETAGEDDDQLPPSQCLADHARNGFPVVRMARIQRWISLRRQFESRDGLLELQSDSDVCCRSLGYPRLETCPEVVDGWLVFRSHLGSCRCYTCVGVHHTLGFYHPRSRDRHRMQLCN